MFDHGFPSDWSTLKKLIWLKAIIGGGGGAGVWKTVTGALIHITNALPSPVQALSVAIEPQQSGSGDPSPTNVRPITGWTGCNIRHTGSNICGGERLKDRVLINVPTATVNTTDKTVAFASNATSSSIAVFSSAVYPFKENTQYTIMLTCKKSSGSGTNFKVKYTDGTTENITGASTSKSTVVFVTAENKTFEYMYKYTASGTTTLYYEESGIFEGVLTASDFEPYDGTVYPISWQTEAGEVYGGTLDVVSGVLKKTMVKYTLTGEESWTDVGSGSKKYFRTKKGAQGYFLYSIDDICSHYKKADITSSTTNIGFTTGNSSSGAFLNFRPDLSVITDEVAWAAFLAEQYANGTPVVCVVKLTTPVEYTLTPMGVNTLLGENNIWANCGDSTLTYKAVPATAFSDEVGKGMADYMTLTE